MKQDTGIKNANRLHPKTVPGDDFEHSKSEEHPCRFTDGAWQDGYRTPSCRTTLNTLSKIKNKII